MDKIDDVRLGELAASASFVFKADRMAAERPIEVYPPVTAAKLPNVSLEAPKKP